MCEKKLIKQKKSIYNRIFLKINLNDFILLDTNNEDIKVYSIYKLAFVS